MPAWWPRRTSSFEIRMTCSAAPSSRLRATKRTFIWIPRPSGCGAQLAFARLLEKKGATRGTAVEQEVERGEPGYEGLRAALRGFRMREFMPLHAHAGPRKGLGVELLARPANPGEQPVGAHRAAKVQDQVCFRALDAELRAARERPIGRASG